jgi:hypothetical protein
MCIGNGILPIRAQQESAAPLQRIVHVELLIDRQRAWDST